MVIIEEGIHILSDKTELFTKTWKVHLTSLLYLPRLLIIQICETLLANYVISPSS